MSFIKYECKRAFINVVLSKHCSKGMKITQRPIWAIYNMIKVSPSILTIPVWIAGEDFPRTAKINFRSFSNLTNILWFDWIDFIHTSNVYMYCVGVAQRLPARGSSVISVYFWKYYRPTCTTHNIIFSSKSSYKILWKYSAQLNIFQSSKPNYIYFQILDDYTGPVTTIDNLFIINKLSRNI